MFSLASYALRPRQFSDQFIQDHTDWRKLLSDKQRAWLRDIAARLRRAA